MLTNSLELIGQAWIGYKRSWRKFIPYMLLLLLAGTIVFLAGYAGIKLELYFRANRLVNDIIIFLIYLASIVFSLWVTIGLTQTAAKAYANQPIGSWRSNLVDNSRLILPVIINSILVTLLIAFGSILFIIPGIIFFVWYHFTSYAIILDNKNWKESFKASKNLVVGRWWKVAWRIFAIMAFFAIISIALQLFVVFVLGFTRGIDAATLSVINNAISSVLNMIITPPLVMSLIGLYFNLRETPVKDTETIKA